MGSNMRDVEEGRRLMLQSLPIVGQLPAPKPKPIQEAKENEMEERQTLNEIISKEVSDVHQFRSADVNSLVEICIKKYGKKTTPGSVMQAIYVLRKGGSGEKLQRTAAKKQPKTAKALTYSKSPSTTEPRTWKQLLTELAGCMESVINERDDLRARLERIAEAARS